jgi:hypothetical protein
MFGENGNKLFSATLKIAKNVLIRKQKPFFNNSLLYKVLKTKWFQNKKR